MDMTRRIEADTRNGRHGPAGGRTGHRCCILPDMSTRRQLQGSRGHSCRRLCVAAPALNAMIVVASLAGNSLADLHGQVYTGRLGKGGGNISAGLLGGCGILDVVEGERIGPRPIA